MQEDGQRTPTGNHNHGVGVCNKCGWKYPNPHPSAKQRRNHKKHCGQISLPKGQAVGFQDLDHPSSPDSDPESQNLEACSSVKTDACTENNAEDDSDELRVERSVGAEVGEASSRFEEDFADASSEFSETTESPRNGFVQTAKCNQPDALTGFVCKTLAGNLEPVGIEREVGAREDEGMIEEKHVIVGDDVVAAASPQTGLDKMQRNEKRENLVASVVNPTHVDSKEGLACILTAKSTKSDVVRIADVGLSVEMVQSGDSPYRSLINPSTKENHNSCRKNETGVNTYHEYQKIIGPNTHHDHENSLQLHRFTDVDNSSKDAIAHLEAVDSMIHKSTEAISQPSNECCLDSQLLTTTWCDVGAFSVVPQILDRSVYIESQSEKSGSQSKGDRDHNCGRKKHEESMTTKMHKNEPVGNTKSASFEVHEDFCFANQKFPFPAEVNACENAFTREELRLLPSATNASTEIGVNKKIAVTSSASLHSTISHHCDQSENLVHEQELKDTEANVTNNRSIVNIQENTNNGVPGFCGKSISLQTEAHPENQEGSLLTTTLTNISCTSNASGFLSRNLAASDCSFYVDPGYATVALDDEDEDETIDASGFIELINYPNDNSSLHHLSKKESQNELHRKDLQENQFPVSAGDEVLTTDADSEIQEVIIQADHVKKQIINSGFSICPGDDGSHMSRGSNCNLEHSSSISKCLNESSICDHLDPPTDNHSYIHEEECKPPFTISINKEPVCTLPTQVSHARFSGEKNVLASEEKDDLIMDLTKGALAHGNSSNTEPFLLERALEGDQLPLDPPVHDDKHQMESTRKPTYPDKISAQIVIEDASTLYILDDEKSSVSSFLSESNNVNLLSVGSGDSSEIRAGLVEGPSNNSDVNLLLQENKLIVSGTTLDVPIAGGCDKSTFQNETAHMASNSEHENSSGMGALRTSVDGGQAKNENQLKGTPCTNNLQMNVVVLPCQSGDETNVCNETVSVVPEEPSAEDTDTTNPSDAFQTQNAFNTNSAVSDVGQLPAVADVKNDQLEGDKAEMGSEKTHVPLKSLLVESKEAERHNRSIQFNSTADAKTPEVSYVNATKMQITSPAWILHNRREKRKNRGLYSWIGCVCCSPMN